MPPRHLEAVFPPPEEILVSSRRVACDGGNGVYGPTLGHPRVYLDLGEDDVVECGYCDRRFVYAAHPEAEYRDPAARPPEAH